MLLNQLQEKLSDLYSLPVRYCIDDFLVTGKTTAAALAAAEESTDETLLIVEAGDESEVALYLDSDLLKRLQRADPTVALTVDNMADFLAALEGVSHFVYYSWHADHDKPVTLLEMELQAEVDKFITAASLLDAQLGELPLRLHRWLFDLPRLATRLSGEQQQRYNDANRFAGRYCLDLYHRLRRGIAMPDLIPELRAFYRSTQQDKIERIRALRCST
jgi:hypothetical protein